MDEASDVGRITLDNKLTIGTRWGAAVAVAVAAQQQRRDFQCDVEERSEELEEEMEETPARSTILSTLVEVLPGTFAFDWFASESPKHVSQSQCASAENNTRIVTKECLEKEQYDTLTHTPPAFTLFSVLYPFQFPLFRNFCMVV